MESNQSNAAAVRAFRVLEVVARHADGCNLATIVDTVGLPKQTVHRIVGQLQFSGLVIREPGSRRIQIGARVEQFAMASLMNGPGRTQRHAILSSLVDAIGETCNLAALAGTEIVYLDRVETHWPLRLMLSPGSHVPLHATASGKLLLSLLPKPQRDRLIDQLPLRSFTERTIVQREVLEHELEETRKRRIGINRAEHLRGMFGLAVPVMLGPRRACAAVAVQAPEGRATVDELMGHVPRLREAAERIAATFGAIEDE
ncbi:MAG TPA: IclR family transcriptional regulator [Usitatibacter sp.]|nr:IclR family transcriptional regulator [Usitatibacter sp.]